MWIPVIRILFSNFFLICFTGSQKTAGNCCNSYLAKSMIVYDHCVDYN